MKIASMSVSGGIATLLAGLFAVELCFALPWPSTRPPARTDTRTVSANPGDSGYPPDAAISAWGEAAVARPLFASSRRPHPAPSQAAAAPQTEISRLTGIIVTPTEKIAVFSPPAGAPIIVTKNSRMGAFIIVAIAADSVTVRGPDGPLVMHLDTGYKGQPGSVTPAETILPGGIVVHFIHIPLGSVEPGWPSGLHPF